MIALMLFILPCYAAIPITPDSLQLQALVKNSKEQLILIKQLVEQGQRDEDSLRRAVIALDKLSQGLDRSLEKYQGTKVYEQAQAMLESQSRPNHDAAFRSAAIAANREELAQQLELSQALKSAEAGFVPKIHAQAQIGAWRANTRISMQLDELNAQMAELRQGAGRRGPFDLSVLIRGSQQQNAKQREAARNELR